MFLYNKKKHSLKCYAFFYIILISLEIQSDAELKAVVLGVAVVVAHL